MFTFTTLSSPERSSAIRSSTGAIAWHGPHHSAQKSTITGLSLCSTSCSKVVSVTAVIVLLSLFASSFHVPQRLGTPNSSQRVAFVCEADRWRGSGEQGGSPSYPENRDSSTRSVTPRLVVMFEKLPPVPDHPALERGILEVWEREGTFERVRDRNRGGPRFSFMDGPITANN